MLIGEYTLLDEPTEVPEVVATAVFPADGPDDIRSERRIERRDPT
jgi:hypothetical protein